MASSLLLIDGTGLLVRSNRAGRNLGLVSGGQRTGPLLLFVNTVLRLLREHQPAGVLVALDGKEASAWRRSMVPLYKSDREPPPAYGSREAGLVIDFLQAAGVGWMSYLGYEADDVIAWAIRRSHFERGLSEAPVIIASDDSDLHQLITHRVTQVPLSGKGQAMDFMAVKDRYGCAPWHLHLLKALAGDPSDCIPGLPGVGLKRGLKLLCQAGWTLAGVKHPDMNSDRELELAVYRYAEIMDLCNPVRAIDMEPGMDQYPFGELVRFDPASRDSLRVFLDQHEMASVSQRLTGDRLW